MAAQITTLPTPPSRQDPANFNDRADAFLDALPKFQTEANALSTEVNTKADDVAASHIAVLAATNITKWVSGSTYAEGAVVWSPINGLGYRRITASGSGTTDPSLDTTNYAQVNGTGNVSTSGNQTIAGTKTFTSPITGSTTSQVSLTGNQTIAGTKTFSSQIVANGGISLSSALPINQGGTAATTALDAFNSLKQQATESLTGVARLSTQAETNAGTDDTTVITPKKLSAAKIVDLGTVNTTSGNSFSFTSIPSNARRVTLLFSDVSTSGSNVISMQLGTDASVETTGYKTCSHYNLTTSSNVYANSTAFALDLGSNDSGTTARSGVIVFNKFSSFGWIGDGYFSINNAEAVCGATGSKVLLAALSRIVISTIDTFDGGSITAYWE